MARKAKSARQRMLVDVGGLRESRLVEAELSGCQAQLNNFAPIRERLVAGGQDAAAAYRLLVSRRDTLAKKLGGLWKKLGSTPQRGPHLPMGDLLSLPLDPGWIRGTQIGLGYSGYTQMPALQEGISVIPPGRYVSGELTTTELGSGYVNFEGWPSVGPDQIAPNLYDPSIRYFWLRNWHTIVVFPAPVVNCDFTYQFRANAWTTLYHGADPGVLMAFVSVGETANYVGQQVAVNADGGWPWNLDLSQLTGFRGSVQGQEVTVRRTLYVRAGQRPAVAIVIGAAVGLPMMTDLRIGFWGGATLSLYEGNVAGRVAFSYRPQLVVSQQ
ncbi:MAG: hypothetical protein E6G97_03290 [Alphaproteobacteria bacterium]|nr:MAG: hypothetical protein E6G97_03290 [Alphaproteobacteria bacterium]